MPKRIHLEERYTVAQWHDNIKHIRNNEHKLKMLVIEKILANPSVSAKEVQATFFISPRTMYNWINQYNENGLEGLKEGSEKKRGSGKGNKRYDDKIYMKLKKEMEQSDKKWTLRDKQFYLEKEFGIKPTFPTISKGLDRV